VGKKAGCGRDRNGGSAKRRTPPARKRKKPGTCRSRRRGPAPCPSYTQKKTLALSASAETTYLPAVDTSRQTTYSFGIVNRGESPVVARIQISPDGEHFAEDAEETIEGGRTAALVPMRFLRYSRVAVRTLDPGAVSVVDVYYQAQSAS